MGSPGFLPRAEVSSPVSQSTHLLRPWMQPARSLVIAPLSTVCTHTFSRVCANLQEMRQSEALACWADLCGLLSVQIPPMSSPDEVLVPIQLPSMLQTPCPGEDAGNRVGTGGPALGTGHGISRAPDTAVYLQTGRAGSSSQPSGPVGFGP